MELSELLLLYRRTLLQDIVPFWMKYASDPAGGINTCLRDDGSLTDTVAMPVQDPFHLPRALILCLDVLERISAGTSRQAGNVKGEC